jgi:hypothetical protein
LADVLRHGQPMPTRRQPAFDVARDALHEPRVRIDDQEQSMRLNGAWNVDRLAIVKRPAKLGLTQFR